MRLIPSLSLGAVLPLALLQASQAATILSWTFTAATGPGTTETADFVDPNLTPTPELTATGFTNISYGDGYSFRALNAASTSSTTDYVEFTVAPAAGYQATFNSLSFGVLSREVQSLSFELFKQGTGDAGFVSLGTTSVAATGGSFSNLSIDFTDFTDAAGVVFRLSSVSTTGGQFNGISYQGEATASSTPAIVLDGTVALIPEPSSLWLMAGATLAGFARRRRA